MPGTKLLSPDASGTGAPTAGLPDGAHDAGGVAGSDLPTAHGAPLLAATLGRAPEDFRVDECLGFEPDGTGEHLWLHVEKRLLNTADVIALLERVYAVGSADVGASGLKDRRAITRQWLSVRTPRDVTPLADALARDPTIDAGVPGTGSGSDASAGERPALRVLAVARHSRKLRRGTHTANAFVITLRDVTVRVEADGALDARLEALRTTGFPNYLGPQRFGRDGRNVARARAWFRAPRRRTTRLQRGLWLSAARSVLFNRVCAARVANGSWTTLLDGEPVSLDGSRAFFVPGDGRTAGDEPGNGAAGGRDIESLDQRLVRGDIHPSGPWWGRGASPARGDCASFERRALADLGDLCEGLERAGLDQERRALRARPRELRLERLSDGDLRLRFTLAPGTFATMLLAELGPCVRPEVR